MSSVLNARQHEPEVPPGKFVRWILNVPPWPFSGSMRAHGQRETRGLGGTGVEWSQDLVARLREENDDDDGGGGSRRRAAGGVVARERLW